MAVLNDISAANEKTRVLLFSSEPLVADFFRHLLLFNHKEADFYGIQPLTGADFIIFTTSDTIDANTIRPNILLADSATEQAEMNVLISSMTGGGALIFPDHLNTDETTARSFFRQMSYAKPCLKKDTNGNIQLQTELGDLTVASEQLLYNIPGLQLLAQQFGIMEEEFYEALLEYDPS